MVVVRGTNGAADIDDDVVQGGETWFTVNVRPPAAL